MKITNNINTFILNFMGQYSISPLIEEASSRIYYRIRNKKNSYIFLDARNEKKQFNSQLNVYKILKDINISIPKILKYNKNDCLMILEDFGDNRFDKRINSLYRSRHLFNIAIKSLIILKNSVYYEKKMKLHKYNFINLKNEISEFIDWYYKFVWGKKISITYKKNFIEIWKKTYEKIDFNQHSFVHKDFFNNNLIYLPSRKSHLKCGIIDYQDAFWGDETLDIVSLFEDSRRITKTDFKKNLITFFLKQTNQIKYKDEFYLKYNFIGASRQTRILGRWIKLMKNKSESKYLNYINSTWYWLERNLNHPQMSELKKIYLELIPVKKRKYEN